MKREHLRSLALFGAAVLAVACTDIITDPDVPVAIEILPAQLPFIVEGDSLRDTLGVATPLDVRVLNSDNEVIPNFDVSFLVIDAATRVTIDPQSGLIRGIDTGTVRVVANAGDLQSTPVTLVVTLRPDTFTANSPLRDSMEFLVGRETRLELRTFVGHDTTPGSPLGAPVPVRSYVVRFTIVDPPGHPTNDSTVVQLVNDNNRASTVDTTDASGEAKRVVRIAPAVRTSPPDSIIVEATALRPDRTPVPGSPLRFIVKIGG
ncbi:MAG TPA: hypothetical protein VJ672_06750 [Gemmatimonadaceae bacterium]|nr:hypothetical protein [Gemmatimonadaceae bacterium]